MSWFAEFYLYSVMYDILYCCLIVVPKWGFSQRGIPCFWGELETHFGRPHFWNIDLLADLSAVIPPSRVAGLKIHMKYST